MTVTRRLVGPKLPPACRRVVCVGLICVATAALLAACDDEPVPTATTQPANTPTPVATSTPPPTATATPTPTPERRPVSEEIDALAWVKDGTTDDEKRGPVATSTPPPTATATPTPTPELTPTPTPERRPVSEEIDALAWVKDGTTDDEKRGPVATSTPPPTATATPTGSSSNINPATNCDGHTHANPRAASRIGRDRCAGVGQGRDDG